MLQPKVYCNYTENPPYIGLKVNFTFIVADFLLFLEKNL